MLKEMIERNNITEVNEKKHIYFYTKQAASFMKQQMRFTSTLDMKETEDSEAFIDNLADVRLRLQTAETLLNAAYDRMPKSIQREFISPKVGAKMLSSAATIDIDVLEETIKQVIG